MRIGMIVTSNALLCVLNITWAALNAHSLPGHAAINTAIGAMNGSACIVLVLTGRQSW